MTTELVRLNQERSRGHLVQRGMRTVVSAPFTAGVLVMLVCQAAADTLGPRLKRKHERTLMRADLVRMMVRYRIDGLRRRGR